MYAYFERRLKGISMNLEEMSNTLLEAIAKNLDTAEEGRSRHD